MAIKGVRTTVNDDLPGPASLGGEFSTAKREGRGGSTTPTGKDVPVTQIKEKNRAPKAMAYPTKNGTHIRKPYEELFDKDRV